MQIDQMPRAARRSVALVCLCGLLLVVTACSRGGSDKATPPPGAAAVEQNPPGDIPDDQAFVTYQSPVGGYAIQVPEGWARQEDGPHVTFSDKLHAISVEIVPAASAPTTDSIKTNEIPQLQQRAEAFEQVKVEQVDLPAGQAILIRYRTNSQPDAVTGKKTRLEVDRYEFFRAGKLAILSLAAPQGSDNVDVWNQISRSFQWQ